MRFNPKKFDSQMDAGINKVRKRLKATAIEAADFAVQKLALVLSPVWAGSYVLSHRIGIGSKNDSGPTNKTPGLALNIIPPKAPLGIAMKYRRYAASRAKIRLKQDMLPKIGKIIIYNQAPHAMLVETMPDKYMTGRLSPYYPYGKVKLILREQIPAIIQEIKRKYR